MSQKNINIPGIGDVLLTKKRGNRNIRMGFAKDGSVRVSMPHWVPFQAGIQFAISRKDWIDSHRPDSQSALGHYDRIGKAHRIAFTASYNVSKPTVRVKNNIIQIKHPALERVSSPSVQAAAERGTHKALKLEADQLLPQRLLQLAREHGFDYKTVNTKRLTSRWGSCSQFKEITLNIYLMQLPWYLIDYVLMHELVHTEHLDHSSAFWHRFERAMPGARRLRRQLKNYRTAIIPTHTEHKNS